MESTKIEFLLNYYLVLSIVTELTTHNKKKLQFYINVFLKAYCCNICFSAKAGIAVDLLILKQKKTPTVKLGNVVYIKSYEIKSTNYYKSFIQTIDKPQEKGTSL